MPASSAESAGQSVPSGLAGTTPSGRGGPTANVRHRRGVTASNRPLWMLIPGGVLMILVIVVPILLGLYISLLTLDQYTLRQWLSAPFTGLGNYIEAGKGRAEPLTEGVLIKSEERYVQAKQDRHHDNEDHQNTARDQHPEWAVARGYPSSVPDVRRRASATGGGLAGQSAWNGLAGRLCRRCRHVKPYGALSSEDCAVFCAAVSSDCNFEVSTDPFARSGIVCTTTFIRAS